MKKNKTILILGASGEIAQYFINNYDNNKNILLFDLKLNKTLKKKYKKNYFSKFTKDFIKKANNSNIIINFIGEIYLTDRMIFKNVFFLKKILKILDKKKKKLFIHLSTAGIYNYLDLETNSKYENKLAYNFYEKTKIDGENLLFEYDKFNRKFKLKIIRVAGLIDLKKSNLRANLYKLSKFKFIILLKKKKSYIFYFKKKLLIKKILFLISSKNKIRVINLIKSKTIILFYKKLLKLDKLYIIFIPPFIENILKKILIFNIKYIRSSNYFFKYLSLLFSNKKIIHKK
jgi:nucleoside-diphosphate-sugar epimerase